MTTRTTRMPAFWGYPRHLMITHSIESYWIPSQMKTKSKSGHGMRDRWTDRTTNGRTDGVKAIYPPTTLLCEGGGIMINDTDYELRDHSGHAPSQWGDSYIVMLSFNGWVHELTKDIPFMGILVKNAGIILCMHQANERWCYNVTLSPIAWEKMIPGNDHVIKELTCI